MTDMVVIVYGDLTQADLDYYDRYYPNQSIEFRRAGNKPVVVFRADGQVEQISEKQAENELNT